MTEHQRPAARTMSPFRYRAIVEADHDIQNPLSPEKLRRLIDYLRLADGDRVVDVGCGKGWLLAEMAAQRRIEAVGLEINPAFATIARRALAPAPGVQIVDGPALDHPQEPGAFDVALCIGATFALGGLHGAIDWLARAARPGGRVAIGEPFALRPFPPNVAAHWAEYDRTAADIADLMAARGLMVTGVIASSTDDWDHYESQHWRAAAAWLRAHPDDPDAAWLAEKAAADCRRHLSEERDCFGWAVFVAEKT